MADVQLLRDIEGHLNTPELRQNLTSLFCETLCWGSPQGHPIQLAVGAPVNRTLTASPVAQLGGLPVFRVDWNSDQLPNVTQRRAVHRALAPIHLEHLLCYITQDGRQAAFVWARKRADGKKVELRTLPYEVGSPARTTIERLGELAFTLEELKRGEPPVSVVMDKLDKAFDVEAVNKAFFAGYEQCFYQEVKPAVLIALDGDDEAAHQFTQLLFNRLMFCWFLQKKGWLGGSPTYLLDLLDRAHHYKPPKNLYHDYLTFLFFEVLANPEEQRRKRHPTDPHVVMEAPFLNGGLFERTHLDFRVEEAPRFKRLPNSVFKAILKDLFARYNFTVEESTSLDIQVALDPELLGTIFERLVTGRHETGSYYTPKPVVEFMCREALSAYLKSETRNIKPETIDDLVYNHSVEHLSPTDANDIIRALDTIKVCDPACGSGAYLVTMLHELVAIYRAIYSEKLNDPQKDYDLKLRIIERNLYGVDIDPFAVNIAKLRLWLTLIVDSEETDWRRVKPLPNLDYKIEVGDSLTAPNPQAMPNLFRAKLIQHADRLTDLKSRYLRAYGEEKKQLAKQICSEEQALRDVLRDAPAPKGSLDWRVAFPEVFKEKQGFDIIVMNPPYVSANRVPGEKRKAFQVYMQQLRPLYGFVSDLYVHFMYRALQLLRDGGYLYAITSNTYLTNTTKEHLRRHLLQHTLRLLMPLSPDVFAAVVYSAILGVQKGRQSESDYEVLFLNVRHVDMREIETVHAFSSNALRVPVSEYERSFSAIFFEPTPENRRLFSMLLSAQDIVNMEGRRFVPLEKVAPALDTGIDTGNVRHKLFYREQPPNRKLPRLIQGRQVVRYGVWWENPEARYYYVDINYKPNPNRKGIGRGGKLSGRGEYWHFRGPIENHHVIERLLMRQTEDEPFVGYIYQGSERIYTDNTVHTLLLTDYGRKLGLTYRYLLAVLNSSTLRRIYQAIAQEEGRTLAQVKTTLVNRLPIALPSEEERRELESLVECIQQIYSDNGFPLPPDAAKRVAELGREIDERVAGLYSIVLEQKGG